MRAESLFVTRHAALPTLRMDLYLYFHWRYMLQMQEKRTFHTGRQVFARTKLQMPALSPTMTEGTIVEWKKKEGEKFKPGDVLCEVETDKATVPFEATEEGYLARILVKAGTARVQVGADVAIAVDEESEIADAQKEDLSTPPSAPKQQPKETASEAPTASVSTKPEGVDVLAMPALSPTMSEGVITEWKKKEGDAIKVGDVLCEVETDKATVAFEATEEGFLAKILVPSGAAKVAVGDPIALVVADKADIQKAKDYTPSKGAPQAQPETPAKPSQPSTPDVTAPSKQADVSRVGDRIFASPLARKLAEEKGIDLAQIRGTGPNNRIIAADVREFQPEVAAAKPAAAAPTPAAAAPAWATYVDIPVSNIRRVIAERLTYSKQNIPHYYLTVDCNVEKLLKLREELNGYGKGAYKLSVNDFIVKASALALKKVPQVNSEWRGDVIRQYSNVDINVAVSAPQGLYTPLVRNADTKGLLAISNTIKELAEKAKAGKISLEDLQPGTFTISNLGMFGISHFAAVINPPQAAILAVGATEQRVVEATASQSNEKQFTTKPFMSVTLSCDHRVIDGAVGAEWLQYFRDFIEHPNKMLL